MISERLYRAITDKLWRQGRVSRVPFWEIESRVGIRVGPQMAQVHAELGVPIEPVEADESSS